MKKKIIFLSIVFACAITLMNVIKVQNPNSDSSLNLVELSLTSAQALEVPYGYVYVMTKSGGIPSDAIPIYDRGVVAAWAWTVENGTYNGVTQFTSYMYFTESKKLYRRVHFEYRTTTEPTTFEQVNISTNYLGTGEPNQTLQISNPY